MFTAALFLLFFSPVPQGSSPLLGDWITPNRSVVRVFSCDDTKLCMRLVSIGPKGTPSVDVNNPVRADRDRPLCGLEIGSGFTPDGKDHASDGHIYDPESGKTYSAEIALDGSTLKLRGYVGMPMFGRTETWSRSHQSPTCG